MADLRVVISVPRDVSALLTSGAHYAVTDLDTATPKLTVNSLTFLGTFHDTVGTDVLFAPDGRVEGVSTKRLVFAAPDPKKTEGKKSDGKKSDGKKSDGKKSEEKQSDGRKSDGKKSEGRKTYARKAKR